MSQSKLIYSILESGDEQALFKVRDAYLAPQSLTIFNFIKSHLGKYGKMPDVPTVEGKFSVTLPPNTEKPDFWIAETVEKYQELAIEEAILNAAKNKKDGIKFFQEAIVKVTANHEVRAVDYGGNISERKQRYMEYVLKKGVGYLSSGLTDVDEATKGFKRADLWTFGGREGIGKTWFILRLALLIDGVMKVLGTRLPILFVSCEMDIEECEDRADCIGAKISYDKFLSGDLSRKQARQYHDYMDSLETNLKFIDDCTNMDDVERYIQLFRPAIVFIDGSHLLSRDYEWKNIAAMTAQMKKMTRLHRLPIVNTTHLKEGKGKTAKGGDVDDFAYTKGYTRDSDIVGVLYADEEMEAMFQIGAHFVKIRRGFPIKLIYETNTDTMEFKLVQKAQVTGVTILDDEEEENTGLL